MKRSAALAEPVDRRAGEIRVLVTTDLLARGLDAARLDELTCPIGIAGITDKQPAAIALAVAAQMLQLHNARQWLNQAHALSQPTVSYPE